MVQVWVYRICTRAGIRGCKRQCWLIGGTHGCRYDIVRLERGYIAADITLCSTCTVIPLRSNTQIGHYYVSFSVLCSVLQGGLLDWLPLCECLFHVMNKLTQYSSKTWTVWTRTIELCDYWSDKCVLKPWARLFKGLLTDWYVWDPCLERMYVYTVCLQIHGIWWWRLATPM